MSQLYNRIMKFDTRIRFAALVDENGRILEGGMREGVKPVEPLETTPHLIAKLVSALRTEDFVDFFGRPEYSILVHEQLIVLIFRSGRGFVLVTANKKFGFTKVTKLRTLLTRKQSA